ncbi:MAG: DUF3224 domain-containing protein [Deltaproteobacteria bacterium]|nr:DUF3224 domain-containing protein [Deltaproteobacteria bacterium]
MPVTVYDDATPSSEPVRYPYRGLRGESTLRYHSASAPPGARGAVRGVERFVGRLNGREGSIFWLNNGAWRSDGAPSAAGDPLRHGAGFAGLRGTVRFHDGSPAEKHPLPRRHLPRTSPRRSERI